MLICDLAETYHIFDYRSLPPSMVMTFVAGLRDDSRLVQKTSDVKASQQNLLLAHIADKLSILIRCFAGDKAKFESMVSLINGENDSHKSNVMSFESNDDFQAYWDKLNNGG